MKQQRNTKQRQLVLEVVRARDDHPTADQIYLDVRAIDDKISRGTVYRNLNLLSENGEILSVVLDNIHRFDRRKDIHSHLTCTRCGKVLDVSLDYQQQLDQLLAQQTGYVVDRHTTVFEGICPECQQAATQKNTEEDEH